MFGLGNSGESQLSVMDDYEIEKELRDPQKLKETIKLVEEHFQIAKELLRSGVNNETFQRLSTIITGYQAALKVLARFALQLKSKSK